MSPGGKSRGASARLNPRLPDHGPLDIADWDRFLEQSKADFVSNFMKSIGQDEKVKHFKKIEIIGSGSFGVVMLVRHRRTGEQFAMKALEKEQILRLKLIERTRNEKSILQCLNFPFTVYLRYFFVDRAHVYFVMPFVPGGELLKRVRLLGRLEEADAKFYASQVVLALEYLHHLDLVYRDLKLENVLIDQTGFVKIADFGFCKRLSGERTYTLCGTLEYLAPEVVLNQGYGKAADWWSVGVFVCELSSGISPFSAHDETRVYKRIVSGKYTLPRLFSEKLRDLVRGLLQGDLSRRLGNLRGGVSDVKGHRWFREINWLATLNRRVRPPFVPRFEKAGSSEHFERLSLSHWEPVMSSKHDFAEELADF